MTEPMGLPTPFQALQDVHDYFIDAFQRSVLFLDVLRQRGKNAREYNARTAPNVPSFEAELLCCRRRVHNATLC